MPTKYVSKIHKGSDDIYIKDSEARESIEENRLKLLGDVSSLSPTSSYAKTSLITQDGSVYISSQAVTGLPDNTVVCNNEVVTCNSATVTCGANSVAAWVKIV